MLTISAPAVLRLSSVDALASHTKIQLLLALDRYADALRLLASKGTEQEYAKEQVYCLYKTGRIADAGKAIEALHEQGGDEDRAIQVLEAQTVRALTIVCELTDV